MTVERKPISRKSAEQYGIAVQIAELIREFYDVYSAQFLAITRRSKRRFESGDWRGRHKDALERLDIYDRTLDQVAKEIDRILGSQLKQRAIWKRTRRTYSHLLKGRPDRELAETFFNSVTRKILQTIGIDREIEFFRVREPSPTFEADEQIYKCYHGTCETRNIIREILEDFRYAIPFENLDLDAQQVAREIDLHLWPLVGYDGTYSIEVIRSPFYRNKVAYVVGRINTAKGVIPLVLPLYNGEGGIYVDTVLMIEADVSRVFSFAYSYFHVEVTQHHPLISFLRSILPRKPLADLYTSIGYNKHGKTVFYRDLHKFVHQSKEQFVIAPGKEGVVMIGFTMPSYNYVFKVIKERPCFLRTNDLPGKRTTPEEVRRKYSLVCHRDRVGRLVDTQEFENMRFRRGRFADNLLQEFAVAARSSVTVEEGYVILHHLYVQRKVTPLPMFLEAEKDPETIRRVILDFGYFLKDLAATGIFPSDLFNIWNYGVTSRGRVVLFDYDDVVPLEKTNFRVKPAPRDEFEEVSLEESWISATPDDFFMDELDRYSGIPQPLKGVFTSAHSDLFKLEFWNDMKSRVLRGEIVDITPYDHKKKFRQRAASEIFRIGSYPDEGSVDYV